MAPSACDQHGALALVLLGSGPFSIDGLIARTEGRLGRVPELPLDIAEHRAAVRQEPPRAA